MRGKSVISSRSNGVEQGTKERRVLWSGAWSGDEEDGPDHTVSVKVKKSLAKVKKWQDFSESVTNDTAGDGPSLVEENPVLKMPGGRVKGSATYHSKEHKVMKDHKDRKGEKDSDENMDHSKVEEDTAGATEAMDDDTEGQNRRGHDGETLLQWGQRKRPRCREPSGLVNSIRVDRRVVRADKQIAAQPVRGITVRPSLPETASGTGKRKSDSLGTPVATIEGELRPPNVDQETSLEHHPAILSSREKAPTSNNGGHGVTAAVALRRVDNESSQEKNLAVEKVNMELYEWPKIVVSLTRKEKEDDFTAMKGTKLPQRPKRRPKAVEKNVQFISPGTWLCDLTRERYEVREKKTVKKKPRGLKAMGSADSDTD